jgi:hypothetical protein
VRGVPRRSRLPPLTHCLFFLGRATA